MRAWNWLNHHTADVLIGTAQTLLLASGPVGWGIDLTYFVADLVSSKIGKQ